MSTAPVLVTPVGGEPEGRQRPTEADDRSVKRQQAWRRAITGWSFAAPFTVLFVVFAALPVVASLVMSVTDLRATDLRHPLAVNFVGLGNYSRLLDDVLLRRAAVNT